MGTGGSYFSQDNISPNLLLHCTKADDTNLHVWESYSRELPLNYSSISQQPGFEVSLSVATLKLHFQV